MKKITNKEVIIESIEQILSDYDNNVEEYSSNGWFISDKPRFYTEDLENLVNDYGVDTYE